jgi:uncharacterized protein YndB with AHSA1/START domain
MATDRIEREIWIDAPIEVVWSVVTEPDQITQWFSDGAEFEGAPGARGTLTFRGSRKGQVDPQPDSVVNLRIERVEPPRYFSFRWDSPAGADPDATNSPLVEFTLTEDGDATRLKLVESGLRLPDRTEDENDRYVADHNRGWDHHLGLLRRYAETLHRPQGQAE